MRRLRIPLFVLTVPAAACGGARAAPVQAAAAGATRATEPAAATDQGADERARLSAHEVVDAQAYPAGPGPTHPDSPPAAPSDPSAPPSPRSNVAVSSAESAIRAMLIPRVRRCYNAGLEKDPTTSGQVTVDAKPTSDHCRLRDVKVEGLSPEVAQCIKKALEQLDVCNSESIT